MASHPPFEFITREPTGPLSPYVESIWYARGPVSYRRERILPHGRIILIFNLGSPFQVSARRYPDGEACQRCWLVGAHTRYLVNEPLGSTHMVGITFRPWSAAAFLDIDCREVADQIIPGDLLWGREVELIRDQLDAAPSPGAKIAVVERALLRRFKGQRLTLSPLEYAVRRLEVPDSTTISALTKDLSVSRKHLNTLFQRYVGLPAKAYARIYRFNLALERLSITPPVHG